MKDETLYLELSLYNLKEIDRLNFKLPFQRDIPICERTRQNFLGLELFHFPSFDQVSWDFTNQTKE